MRTLQMVNASVIQVHELQIVNVLPFNYNNIWNIKIYKEISIKYTICKKYKIEKYVKKLV